jgi:hypothetical protein
MDNQENAQASMQSGQPGFFDLVKISLVISLKSILKYIWLAIVLILPVIIVGALAGFLMARLSFAKPQIPSQAVENTVSHEVSLPAEQGAGSLPATQDQLKPEGGSEVAPTAPAPTGSVGLWSNPTEGTPPTKVGNTSSFFGDTARPTVESSPSLGFQLPFLLLSGSAAVSGIFMLLILLYQMVVVLAFLRLTVLIEHGEALHFGQIVGWSFKKVGTFILMTLRVFVYSFVWVPLVGILAYTIFTFLASREIPMPLWIPYGIGLLSLLSVPLIIFRAPKVMFAQYALADRECSSKEALLYSLQITKGHWWKTVLYILGMSFLSGFLVLAIQFVLLRLVPLVALVASPVLSGYLAINMMIFTMGLYRLLEMLSAAKQP